MVLYHAFDDFHQAGAFSQGSSVPVGHRPIPASMVDDDEVEEHHGKARITGSLSLHSDREYQ